MKDLYIVGAGGFGREVAWLVECINQHKQEWEIRGFLDDNIQLHGREEGGYPILGGTEYLDDLKESVWVVCAVGAAVTRKKIVSELKKKRNIKFATLVAPDVMCSERVVIGEGSIICSGTIITVDIQIGEHVIVNLDCTIGHDARIQDFVTIYPSVNVSGCVVVEEGAELGTGTQIIQGKRIGEETIVGAGAVVVKDLPAKCTAVGSPANPIKYREQE